MRQPRHILLLLAALALLVLTLFMTVGVRGNWAFVLALRATKLGVICLVAHAVATATLLFQTISGNRILTPAVMGFDSLYVLLQTALFMLIGALSATALPSWLVFPAQVGVMTVFASLLYRQLFSGSGQSLHLMILVGIVLGTLFRSLASFLQGLIDPNEFVVLQGQLFANFNNASSDKLGVAAVLIGLASVLAWRQLRELDVLALGRERAINLGVDYHPAVTRSLALIAVLVAVSTALVGPVTFFGLLVVHLAYRLMPSHRHAQLLPAASLIAIILLVAGQFVLERVFSFGTALSMVIEFGGGILFLFLLLRGATR